MSKQKSFWEWLLGSSCCGTRDKDKSYTGREKDDNKDRSGEQGKVKRELPTEDEEEPGSIFRDVDLQDSVYVTGASEDGSVEIR